MLQDCISSVLEAMASSCNRDFGRVRPTQNENQPRQPKGLSANTNNGRETRAAQKRTVLGSITNNVRVQPSRAAKVSYCVYLCVNYCSFIQLANGSFVKVDEVDPN